jgi:hypothetical protein
MKKLIVLVLTTVALTSIYCQQPKIESYKLFIPRDSLIKLMAGRYSFPAQAKLSDILLNGDKVYLLPLDHTLCIVPDTSRYNYKMPVMKEKITGFMPNASPREQIIPNNKRSID